MRDTVIYLHPEAPAQPAPGAACNGCGVCCTWQPCPLGMLVSRRRSGSCRALQWQAARAAAPARYVCGLLAAPQVVYPALPAWAAALIPRLAARWIAAGIGCDCDLVTQPQA